MMKQLILLALTLCFAVPARTAEPVHGHVVKGLLA